MVKVFEVRTLNLAQIPTLTCRAPPGAMTASSMTTSRGVTAGLTNAQKASNCASSSTPRMRAAAAGPSARRNASRTGARAAARRSRRSRSTACWASGRVRVFEPESAARARRCAAEGLKACRPHLAQVPQRPQCTHSTQPQASDTHFTYAPSALHASVPRSTCAPHRAGRAGAQQAGWRPAIKVSVQTCTTMCWPDCVYHALHRSALCTHAHTCLGPARTSSKAEKCTPASALALCVGGSSGAPMHMAVVGCGRIGAPARLHRRPSTAASSCARRPNPFRRPVECVCLMDALPGRILGAVPGAPAACRRLAGAEAVSTSNT